MRRRLCGLESEYLIILKIIMKKLVNSRALLISALFVIGLGLPANAQNIDFFFYPDAEYGLRTEDCLYYNLTNQHFGDEDNVTYHLYNQHFGQTVPLGEGLLIMIGAGVCYVVRKRKKTLDY